MKKLISLLLALVMILGLTACGATATPTEPATEPTEPATEPATGPAEETTEAPTVPTSAASPNSSDSKTGKSFIGILWPLSVLAAFLGGFAAPMLLRKRK